jgi:chemotaxis protein CheD
MGRGVVNVVEGLYLHPGRVAAFAGPARITAILGSCVAVCLFDVRGGLGGMNHFLLPHEGTDSPRLAGPALDALLAALDGLGAHRKALRAKLFGGAWPLGVYAAEPPLGLLNVRAARAALERHRIPLLEEDVGEMYGRKLAFDTDGGAAVVRRLGAPRTRSESSPIPS